MTNFIFENEAQINKMGEAYFGDAGSIQKVTKSNIPFLMYLVAYRICRGKKVNFKSFQNFKEKAKKEDNDLSIRIFFEKVEGSKEDVLYFMNKMENIEELPTFQMAYEKYAAVA